MKKIKLVVVLVSMALVLLACSNKVWEERFVTPAPTRISARIAAAAVEKEVCTLGVDDSWGELVAIQIEGSGAEQACASYIEADPTMLRHVPEQPSKPVSCTYYITNLTYTVRDSSDTGAPGKGWCDYFADLIPSPTSTPSRSGDEVCTLAIADYAAVIEITGPDAKTICEVSLEGNGWSDNALWGIEYEYWPSQEQPNKEITCTYETSEYTYTVRDTGYAIVGRGICDDLAEAMKRGAW